MSECTLRTQPESTTPPKILIFIDDLDLRDELSYRRKKARLPKLSPFDARSFWADMDLDRALGK